MDAMCQAYIICAGREKPPVHPVMAQIALLGDALVFIKGDRAIRAGIDAGPASGANVIVHDHNAVLPFGDGLRRTGFGTRRLVAMEAQVDLKHKLRSVIDPKRTVFPHGNQPDARSRPVFLLAGHLAGPAAPTKGIVYR